MVSTIRIKDVDKAHFDVIKREQSVKKGKDLSQEEVMTLLLDRWEGFKSDS